MRAFFPVAAFFLALTAPAFAAEEEWISLFDGKTLKGWHTNPEKIGHGTGGRWRVDDGAIVGEQDPPGSGNGGILLTDRQFGHFELEIDLRPDWGVDSGLFVRSNDRGQCFQMMVDYHDAGNVGHIYGEGTGGFTNRSFSIFGVYGDDDVKQLTGLRTEPVEDKPPGYTISGEEWVKAWKLGDWNTARVRVVGNPPQITTWINGRKVTEFDGASFEHPKYDKEKVAELLGPKGHIAVQVHGGMGWPKGAVCRWKNIRIREVAANDVRSGRLQPGSERSRVDSDRLQPIGAERERQPSRRPAEAGHYERPNIVVIYADDLGYGDLGCFGHPTIRTPHLDHMAAEGLKLTQFYSAASVCTPSRAALLTGRLPIRSGMCSDKRRVLFPNSGGGLPADEITLAEALKERGYATACVGKWHLGHLPQFLPTSNGFDSYFGIPYSNDMDRVADAPGGRAAFNDPKSEYWSVPLMRDDKIVERPADQTTLTRRYTEEAVRFIREHQDEPFFLYLPHTMPHVPLFRSSEFEDQSRGLYGDVVEEIDWCVGQVLDALRRLDLAENTIVWFSSDNGPWLIFGEQGGSAGLLRDGKGSTWEGGMREPRSSGGQERSRAAARRRSWARRWTSSPPACCWPAVKLLRIASSTAWTCGPRCSERAEARGRRCSITADSG